MNSAGCTISSLLYDREELALDRLFLMVTLLAATFFIVTLNILHYLCNLTCIYHYQGSAHDGWGWFASSFMYVHVHADVITSTSF